MKKIAFTIAAAAIFAIPASSRAEFLFQEYLTPSFYGEANTEFSQWDVFYSYYNSANYPDLEAPNGIRQTASAAGFSLPANSSPSNPTAFWNVNNPTITQKTPGGAFIIGPGTAGNIYSPVIPLSFELNDTTPYTPGTVVLQFQTAGTPVDFNSIKLVGTTSSGTVQLTADQYIQEYRGGSSSFGGFDNRVALQWDLTGLGITSYKILWSSAESSMSFQEALLDTAAVYASVVPESRTWLGTGTKNWSEGGNWQEGSTSVANGNVVFANASAATITLDGNRTVGEIQVDTSANVTIVPQAGSQLTVNTGITTSETAGVTTINAGYVMNAMNLFNIQGGEVHLNGVLSGDYGFVKTGGGKLVLSNDSTNTFGGTSGGVGLQGGTLRMEGVNTYVGTTGILYGRLEVAANALSGSAGALGNSTSAISLGADSAIYSGITEAAQLVIAGDYTVGRNVDVVAGTFAKELGATNTTNGASFTGAVDLASTANNVRLFAEGASDKVTFTGAITGGGVAQTMTINGGLNAGTVVFSGTTKAYASSTIVQSGMLLIASGSGYSGIGNFTVANGATLEVDGTLSGSGTFTLQSGGTLEGSGTVSRTVVTGGVLSVIGASRSEGVLTIASLDATAGVKLSLQIGSEAFAGNALIAITGAFKASIANEGIGIFIEDVGSLQADVVYTLFTFGSQTEFALEDLKLLNTNEGLILDNWQISGNSVQVEFSAVPEPSTWALLIGAVVFGFVMKGRLGRRDHA